MGGLFGGGGGGGETVNSSVPSYTPTGQGYADTTWQQLLGSLTGSNPYTSLLPAYNTAATAQQNDPYAALAQSGANTAGATAQSAGAGLAALAPTYTNEAQSLQPYINQILNMGVTPNNSLYQQDLLNTTNLANVTNAQQGLTGQQAAGSVNNALLNFNNSWQQQQLALAQQAVSAASGVAGTQTGLGGAAQAAGQGGSTLELAGATTPSTQYQGNLSNIINSLTGQGSFGAQNTSQIANAMQEIIPYLNFGVGATNAGANALGANASTTAAEASGLAGLAGLAGNSGAFSGLSGLFGGGDSAALAAGVAPGASTEEAAAAADQVGAFAPGASDLGASSGIGNLISSIGKAA